MATVEGTSHSVTLSLEAEAERLTYVVSDLRGRRQALSDEDTDRLLRADDALREIRTRLLKRGAARRRATR